MADLSREFMLQKERDHLTQQLDDLRNGLEQLIELWQSDPRLESEGLKVRYLLNRAEGEERA